MIFPPGIVMMTASGAASDEIGVLVQERRNSIANALELQFSCTNPSKYTSTWWPFHISDAWCPRATSSYLNQCWPKYVKP